jgi:hypothetical protein
MKSEHKPYILCREIRGGSLISIPFFLSLLVFFTQCTPFISYYDPTTYKNLTDLKPEVVFLYQGFVDSSIDLEKIGEIRLRLAQVYEYEKGKGLKNKETYEQLEIIQNMFERHVKNRLEEGKWTKDHLENVKTNIEEAFDIAIQTEILKNKNE